MIPAHASDWLLLIPTAMERDRLILALSQSGDAGTAFLDMTRIELCGFGLVAAAAMTMRQLNQNRPGHVILAGIAGSLGPECEVGSAYWFSQVVCDGIGVGSEDSHRSAATLGWNHIDADASGAPVGDCLGLHLPSARARDQYEYGLVSRCAASPDTASARAARQRAELTCRSDATSSPQSFATEDMEGFAVALSCRIAGVPLSIVRGISNEAGDRDHTAWQIDAAIASVAQRLISLGSSTA